MHAQLADGASRTDATLVESVTPTDNETKKGLGAHESHARATANPAASTHNNELNTHDE